MIQTVTWVALSCGLAAAVDEDRQLRGGRDIGAVQLAQGGSIAVRQEARVDDDPPGWCGSRVECADHGSVGSPPDGDPATHGYGGSDAGPETRLAAQLDNHCWWSSGRAGWRW